MQEQTTKEGNTNTLFIFATSIIPKTEKKRKKGQVHIR
jgi:hypothetical protein